MKKFNSIAFIIITMFISACDDGGSISNPINANLQGLTVSSGTFFPAFTKDNMTYTLLEPSTVSNITVIPKVDDEDSSVIVNYEL